MLKTMLKMLTLTMRWEHDDDDHEDDDDEHSRENL